MVLLFGVCFANAVGGVAVARGEVRYARPTQVQFKLGHDWFDLRK
jgi:hypothetical protein